MGGDKRSVDCTPRDFLAAGGAETQGRFRAAHARPAATTPASSWTRSAIGSAWPTC